MLLKTECIKYNFEGGFQKFSIALERGRIHKIDAADILLVPSMGQACIYYIIWIPDPKMALEARLSGAAVSRSNNILMGPSFKNTTSTLHVSSL